MQSFPDLRAGALACVLAPVTHAVAADGLLTGIPRLACEATLCLPMAHTGAMRLCAGFLH
ncbi:MAG: TrbM/KikA/MpfK family conjugal transfer protein [Paralcaligenes sp.]